VAAAGLVARNPIDKEEKEKTALIARICLQVAIFHQQIYPQLIPKMRRFGVFLSAGIAGIIP
jgi:hypothetical protein